MAYEVTRPLGILPTYTTGYVPVKIVEGMTTLPYAQRWIAEEFGLRRIPPVEAITPPISYREPYKRPVSLLRTGPFVPPPELPFRGNGELEPPERTWLNRYGKWIALGSLGLLYWWLYKDIKREAGALWPNPTPKRILRRRAYLRALRAPELVELQPADREQAARGLTALFDQNWKPWLKRMVKAGISVHDATYWLPRKPDPELANFLRTHVQGVPRQEPEDRLRFLRDLEIIARGWSQLSPSERKGSVRAVAGRVPEVAFPHAEHVGLSQEAAAAKLPARLYPDVEARWLEAVDKAKPKNLPDVFTAFQADVASDYSGEYIMRRLAQGDPKGLFLGAQAETLCCQKPEHQAESCAWHGVESPNGAFYVMETDDGKLVAMTWAWRKGPVVVFDSIESKSVTDRYMGLDVAHGFEKLAAKMLERDPTINEVRVGALNYTYAAPLRDWQKYSTGYGGYSSRHVDPEDQLRTKILKEAEKAVIRPPHCYSDARYTQRVLATRPEPPKDADDALRKIITSTWMSEKHRYRIAKQLPAKYKMEAAILTPDLTDKQRFRIASEASAAKQRQPALVDMLSEYIRPRDIGWFLEGMTDKQLCVYIEKFAKLPALFADDPHGLVLLLRQPFMDKNCEIGKGQFRSHWKPIVPSIAQELLEYRASPEGLKHQRRKLGPDTIYWLINTTDPNVIGVVGHLMNRIFVEPMAVRGRSAALYTQDTDVARALKARYEEFIVMLARAAATGSGGYRYGSLLGDRNKLGMAIGSPLSGLSVGRRLKLFYRIVDDPAMGIKRTTPAYRLYGESDLQELMDGFISAIGKQLSPKQLERLLVKLITETGVTEKGEKKALELVRTTALEREKLPREMRFWMTMLLAPGDRQAILFRHAGKFTKAQVLDILGRGPLARKWAEAEAGATPNPAIVALRPVMEMWANQGPEEPELPVIELTTEEAEELFGTSRADVPWEREELGWERRWPRYCPKPRRRRLRYRASTTRH